VFVANDPAVPETYSKKRGFALPICCTSTFVVVFSVPLVTVLSLKSDNSLNASVSPDTVPMSGEPCMFVTST